MIVSLSFNLSTLTAMLPFASRDDSRYVLCGVLLECEPRKPATLTATDGRRLLHHRTDWSHDAQEGVSVIIPSDAIKALHRFPKAKKPFPQLSFDTATRKVRAEWLKIAAEFQATDGNYPAWRQVIPSPLPTNFPARMAALNIQFLTDIYKAFDSLCPRESGAQFVSTQEDGAPVIAFSSTTVAALMPLRASIGNPELSPEVTR